MDIQIVPLEQFQSFLFCLSRVGALITAIPVFNGQQTPIQVKVGLAVLVSLLLFPLMGPYTPTAPLNLFEFTIIAANEVILGMMLGLVAQLIFTAVSFGGTIIGYQMGFAAANIFDPQTSQQLSLMSQFQNVLAILIFLALDVHHIFFKVILDSYIMLPPGYMNFSGGVVELLMALGSKMFLLGIKFSAPILAILLISSLVLGIMARVFPQLNVFLLSFPLNIGISFFVIGLTLHLVVRILRREFDIMGENFIQIFQLL